MDIKEVLKKECEKAGGQAAWAALKDISPAYVSDVLSGRRDVGEKILTALGCEKVITYKLKRAKRRQEAGRV